MIRNVLPHSLRVHIDVVLLFERLYDLTQLVAVNCSCPQRWFCLSHKSSSITSTSSSIVSTPSSIDNGTIRDYCETSLDDIVHLRGLLTLEKLSSFHVKRTRSSGYIMKKKRRTTRQHRKARSCCLSALFHSTEKTFTKKKKDMTFTEQILAPIVTLKDLISSSFSLSSLSSSSASDQKSIAPLPVIKHETPQFSCKSLSFDPSLPLSSTPKTFLVHSYTSLSNYRIKQQYSLDEQTHTEECLYCSNENALPQKLDSNNNQFDQISLQSMNLFHAVEMYLSSNNSSHDVFDLSSIASEQRLSFQETKQLNLCEINEIIYAIHTDIDNDQERNEILDSLAASLRQVAEETPVVFPDEQVQPTVDQQPEPAPVPPPGLGQILARAVMYDVVMKLFSFYLLLLMTYGNLF